MSPPAAVSQKPTRLVVIGAGAWGTAIAIHCANRTSSAAQVTLLCRSELSAQTLRNSRENAAYLPKQTLPAALNIASDIGVLREADFAFIVTPVAGLTAALLLAQAHGAKAVVWLCKGLDANTGQLPYEIGRAHV